MSAFDDRRLLARASVALALANLRFWPTVAPRVGAQLKRWEQRAGAIEDRALRTLALEKLRDEGFNAQVAATLATLASRHHRQTVIEAVVAYEVMYDYLDGLVERPTLDPLNDGRVLYQAFADSVTPGREPAGDYFAATTGDDGGYLEELVDVVWRSLARLPSAASISPAARRAATRCADAQVRSHAVSALGTAQLEQWARDEAQATSFGWQAYLAGAASSVLTVHALIAAAADPSTTPEQANTIDSVYLPIAVLSTMLDSLVDYPRDLQAGQLGYIRYYYDDHDVLASDLVQATRAALSQSAETKRGAHHAITLVGVVAYYISAPTAASTFAAPTIRQVRQELEPLITPTLALMHGWRAAKRARHAIASRSDW